jgi:hypothetical protein
MNYNHSRSLSQKHHDEKHSTVSSDKEEGLMIQPTTTTTAPTMSAAKTQRSLSTTLCPPYENNHADASQDAESRPLMPSVEARILAKIAPSGGVTLHSIFPGDRFGRLTRGHLRDSFVAQRIRFRQSNIEALFAKLDLDCRGYITTADLCAHLNKHNQGSVSQHQATNARNNRFGYLHHDCPAKSHDLMEHRESCRTGIDVCYNQAVSRAMHGMVLAESTITCLKRLKDEVRHSFDNTSVIFDGISHFRWHFVE